MFQCILERRGDYRRIRGPMPHRHYQTLVCVTQLTKVGTAQLGAGRFRDSMRRESPVSANGQKLGFQSSEDAFESEGGRMSGVTLNVER